MVLLLKGMSIKKLKRFSHKEPLDSNLFTCLNYDDSKKDFPPRDYIQIAAFDPGVVNTGCRVEKRTLTDSKVETIHQKLFKSGDKKSECHYFVTMKNHLYSIAADIYNCDYILIESQMKTNPEAIRMSQHIISTILSIIEGSRALIIEILPTVKSRSFGIKGLKGRDLKMRAVVEAAKTLSARGDLLGQSCIKDSKKKDDHADVVLYCDAWFRYLNDGNFIPCA